MAGGYRGTLSGCPNGCTRTWRFADTGRPSSLQSRPVPFELLAGGRFVDLLQIRCDCPVVLPGHIPQRVTNHVHDTELDLDLGVFRRNGIREALKTAHAGDQGVLQTTVLQFCQYRQPELRAFGFGKTQAQQFLLAPGPGIGTCRSPSCPDEF